MPLFIPITKIDEEKRLVYGLAADETPDRQGEIWDYEGNKPLWMAWSAAASKATDGKSLGNVRAMHQQKAAGKLTEIEFDDEARTMEICSKVVDDQEWVNCQEGVYTGFSVGGKYVKKWPDAAQKNFKRVIIDPIEISLADLPANPSALFTAVKANGITEQRAFKISAKPDAPAAEAPKARKPSTSEKPVAGTAKKNLYTVSTLAQMLETLGYIHQAVSDERDREGDNSEVPEELGEAISSLGDVFLKMADEEINELLDGIVPEGVTEPEGEKP